MGKGGKIAIAVMLGILAAIFGMLYLNQAKQEALGNLEVVRVWVAKQAVAANVPLTPEALTPAADWIGRQRLPAEHRLDRLGALLNRPITNTKE